jgi:hypothetical protein
VTWIGSLKGGAALFIASWFIHSADHARRGLDASPEGVIWAGTSVAMLACVAITLILTGHGAAPMVAAAVFPSIAIGVTASHLPPDWGPLSDPILVESNTDLWSVAAVMIEVAAALWIGLIAFRVLRRHAFAARIPEPAWT